MFIKKITAPCPFKSLALFFIGYIMKYSIGAYVLILIAPAMSFCVDQSWTKQIFTYIYNVGHWGIEETVSGHGSKLAETQAIRNKLPELLKKLNIKTILDLPCGDFNWMRTVDLTDYKYIGADIVSELILKNQQLYGNSYRTFIELDATQNEIPKVDLIICRDCLVHLPIEDVKMVIQNFKKSGSRYLLATTYPNCYENRSLKTGEWWPQNFLLEPFNFPQPILIIDEESTVGPDQQYQKCLGLWELEDF